MNRIKEVERELNEVAFNIRLEENCIDSLNREISLMSPKYDISLIKADIKIHEENIVDFKEERSKLFKEYCNLQKTTPSLYREGKINRRPGMTSRMKLRIEKYVEKVFENEADEDAKKVRINCVQQNTGKFYYRIFDTIADANEYVEKYNVMVIDSVWINRQNNIVGLI